MCPNFWLVLYMIVFKSMQGLKLLCFSQILYVWASCGQFAVCKWFVIMFQAPDHPLNLVDDPWPMYYIRKLKHGLICCCTCKSEAVCKSLPKERHEGMQYLIDSLWPTIALAPGQQTVLILNHFMCLKVERCIPGRPRKQINCTNKVDTVRLTLKTMTRERINEYTELLFE